MDRPRCNHFSIEVEEVYLAEAPVLLRIPIRRCRLAEHMVSLLVTLEESRELARKITIGSPSPSSEEERQQAENTAVEQVRVAFGPDMEPIHSLECSVARCQESCTPSYQALLRQFGFEEAARAETGSGCLETDTNGASSDPLPAP